MNVLDILEERGFIEKKTHGTELDEFMKSGDVTCYIGFDPTAPSLHVGNLLPIMSLAHMQRHDHRVIALVGGGTGLVGDPSGKAEMRKLLSLQIIEDNAIGIKKQLSNFIDFNDKKTLLLNNTEWLTKLKYIPFLRDIGRNFSVNRMIKAESYKTRLDSEEGLSFIEFNYMLLQAYDFLKLYDDYECRLQMGGSDQWGNIVAGIELVRRMRKETVFGIILPLITTSNGAKMGKTAKGAVWLDPNKTLPYDYYQFWINTDDRDVGRFISFFTFLPMDEIREIEKLKGSDLNSAKTILAFEATQLAHGREEAIKAYYGAIGNFGARLIPKEMLPSSTIPRKGSGNDKKDTDISLSTGNPSGVSFEAEGMPHSHVDMDQLKAGIPAFKMFHDVGLTGSRGASKRLIEQGGAYLNGKRMESFDTLITDADINNEEILLRAGKKRFHKIKV